MPVKAAGGVILPSLDHQPEPPEPVTLAMLVERLALLEQEISLHFDQLEVQGLQTLRIIIDLQQHLANPEQTVPPTA